MASELISSNIISLLIFVTPGFLTTALIGKLYGVAIRMNQFEKTVWSLIASVPIGILFVHLNKIQTFDSFLNYFILHPFLSTIQIILFSLILAIIVSIILNSRILEKISKRIVYNNKAKETIQTDRTVWDRFMDKNFKKPIIVQTKNFEYKGFLSSNSTHYEKREIVLDSPVIIYTDEEGNTEDFPCGQQILLFGEDIESITTLQVEENKSSN